MDLTVQNVYGLLIRSRLLPLADAQAMYQRWQKEARTETANLARFAQWVVTNHFLTEYQATLLVRGHADGFFLNQYKILDRLGKGRMAGVYKAVHPLGQVVAIKVLPPSKARDPQLLGRFQREARLALRLKHANVVRTFQTGMFDGLQYLVMEYLEGETLEDVLQRRGRLLPGEAVRLVHQALQGLQHIHQQGLVHRDLKPANLMLVPAAGPPATTLRSSVKILDIGLGRALFDEAAPNVPVNPGLTTEGMLLGTPDYLAPEQARDARVADIRADIYSLGCVLFHALAGRPPFPDTSVISQMIRHATEPPPSLKSLYPAVPEGLQQIVNIMLAKNPAERYARPEQASQALQAFLAGGTEPAAPLEADPGMRPFLTWLESGDKPGRPVARTLPATQPIMPALAASKPKMGTPQTATKPSSKKRAKKQKKHRPPTTIVPSAKPVPEAPKPIDVELIPAVAPGSIPSIPSGLRLTRRDLLMFGVGTGTVLLAILVGGLIAMLSRGKKE